MGIQKMAWWKTGNGKMDRHMQADFERAQRLAQETGKAVTITLTLQVKPPDPKEPEYMPVVYKRSLKEPAYQSAEHLIVLQNGVAVSDAEQHPDQTALVFEAASEIEKARSRKAVAQ